MSTGYRVLAHRSGIDGPQFVALRYTVMPLCKPRSIRDSVFGGAWLVGTGLVMAAVMVGIVMGWLRK